MIVGSQRPRICHVPEYVSSSGAEAVELAAMAGLELDEWQRFVLTAALGERADGRWSAFEVGLNVSRQNGKGGVLEARELAGLFLLGEELLIHSAHQFDTSMEAFLRMDALLEATPDLSRRVKSVSRSHGSEGFTLFTGQRLRYRTRTKGGGRGFSCNCLVLDEAMDLPESAHGALLPTLSAQENPQVWYTGSAVDQEVHEHGVVFARVRERGIKGGGRLAYFEWSIDASSPADVTPEVAADPAMVAQANPGLGIRIGLDHVSNERDSMDARTFAVERLGVGDWPRTTGNPKNPIDSDAWNALTDVDSEIVGPVCFAFDVTPNRSRAVIVAAGRRDDGLAHVEVVDDRRGTGWVVDRLEELLASHDPATLVCDSKGPASGLIRDLEDRRLVPVTASAAEYANACGAIVDAVDQRTLRHLGTDELAVAVKGAATRTLGDAWAWSRRASSVNIAPLVAASLALWAASDDRTSVYGQRGVIVL